MKYIVYVLSSLTTKKSYVGYTDSLSRRLLEHNSRHNYYTKRHVPWKIIHTEEYESLEDAIAREKYLKSASGRRLVLKKLFS